MEKSCWVARVYEDVIKVYADGNMSKSRSEFEGAKTGDEHLEYRGGALKYRMIDFWRWSYSNTMFNTLRGDFAEYIAATALLDHKSWPNYQTRKHGDLVDLWLDMDLQVEVKSAAYLQSWHVSRYSTIAFDIKAREGYDFELLQPIKIKKRHAHVYVFCLLHHKNIETVDPLNIDQWSFWVIRTQAINDMLGEKQTASLDDLKRCNAIESSYEDLRSHVDMEFSRIGTPVS